MKRLITLVAMLSASLLFAFGQPVGLSERLEDHIGFLTSDNLAGRKAGTRGGRMAAEYIFGEFEKLGLKTFERAEYYHPFTTVLEDGVFRNVVGLIEGINRDEYIVIGAHYDHLGIEDDDIYHGANDNASGTAALLELARIFSEMNYKPTHTLIFAAFDAEEIGLYGSKDLADRFPQGSVKVMINMDMIGTLNQSELSIEGVGTLEGVESIIDQVAKKNGLNIKKKRFETGILTATDTQSFAEHNIPTLSLTTGLDKNYHKPSDTAEKIDYQGLANITQSLAEMIVEIDHTPEVVTSGKVARKHNSGNKNFRFGLTYAGGSNHHEYPGSALQGKQARAWNIGLTALYTYNYVGVRTGATFERRKALTPRDTANPLGAAQTIRTSSVTIPLELMLKTKGSTCLYATAGGYFAYNLDATQDGTQCGLDYLGLAKHELGWQWSLGVRIGGFYIEGQNRYGLTPAYISGPVIYNRTNYCSLGVYF